MALVNSFKLNVWTTLSIKVIVLYCIVLQCIVDSNNLHLNRFGLYDVDFS